MRVHLVSSDQLDKQTHYLCYQANTSSSQQMDSVNLELFTNQRHSIFLNGKLRSVFLNIYVIYKHTYYDMCTIRYKNMYV